MVNFCVTIDGGECWCIFVQSMKDDVVVVPMMFGIMYSAYYYNTVRLRVLYEDERRRRRRFAILRSAKLMSDRQCHLHTNSWIFGYRMLIYYACCTLLCVSSF